MTDTITSVDDLMGMMPDEILAVVTGLTERADRAARREREARGLLINLASKADSTVSTVLALMPEDAEWPPLLGVMTSLDMAVIEVNQFLATTVQAEPRAGQPPQTEGDDYRQPCPNGCLGQFGEGTSGQPVPMYCGQHGCDVESPGMSYKPDEEWGPR